MSHRIGACVALLCLAACGPGREQQTDGAVAGYALWPGPAGTGAGQAPPGHGGPNPGWGGAPPPGLGHDVPPGHLGDPGTPEWFRKDAPRILSAEQSATTATPGDTVTLKVVAVDPHGLALTYDWISSQGDLGVTSAAGDQVAWSAPFITARVDVTVRVQNALGLAVWKTFRIWTQAEPGTAVVVNPGQSIQGAISAAAAAGLRDVVVAAGTYPESLTLPADFHLWGGYDPVTWQHLPGTPTVLASPSQVGMRVVGPLAPARLRDADSRMATSSSYSGSGSVQSVTVTAQNAPAATSSIAVVFDGITGTFNIKGASTFAAGAGGSGSPGTTGWYGCGGSGGVGGNFLGGGQQGWQGCSWPGTPGGFGGPGGSPFGGWGGNGSRGSDGASGTVLANQAAGALLGEQWRALDGTGGSIGGGGGGGGGGGSGLCCIGIWQCGPTLGGKGGEGGYGGPPGGGGGGAGGSIGILIVGSTGIVDAFPATKLQTSTGGAGGRGGLRGTGTTGWQGAGGQFCFAGSGGNGGRGGDGGSGGGGAGGGGGLSVGVLADAAGIWTPASGVTYALGAPGAGGAGGTSTAPGGQAGIGQDVLILP